MKLSQRMLTKWRKEALQFREVIMEGVTPTLEIKDIEKILILTQELLDQHLLKKGDPNAR